MFKYGGSLNSDSIFFSGISAGWLGNHGLHTI